MAQRGSKFLNLQGDQKKAKSLLTISHRNQSCTRHRFPHYRLHQQRLLCCHLCQQHRQPRRPLKSTWRRTTTTHHYSRYGKPAEVVAQPSTSTAQHLTYDGCDTRFHQRRCTCSSRHQPRGGSASKKKPRRSLGTS